jgi:anti-sigma28 factor (negative regulator of flagellin synthesis)
MSIRSIGSPYGAQRAAAPAPATSRPAAAAEATTAAPAASRRDTRDTVAISAGARALAARGADAPLTAERVDELRKKVLEGAYNQTQVVDQVAKRLLASGDV